MRRSPIARRLRRRLYRRHLVLRLTTDRALPLAIALIVLIAAGASLAPGRRSRGRRQAHAAAHYDGDARVAAPGRRQGAPWTSTTRSARRSPRPAVPRRRRHALQARGRRHEHPVVGRDAPALHGQEGDTLTGIASRYGVSMMTVWWANKIDDEGVAQGRPGPDHPAGQRVDRHGQGRRHARVARRGRTRSRPTRSSRSTSSTTRTSSSARCSCSRAPRASRCPTPKPTAPPAVPVRRRLWRRAAARRSTRAAPGRGPSSAAATTSASTSTTATRGRHRGRLRLDGRFAPRRDGDLRGLGEHRRRLQGWISARQRDLHDRSTTSRGDRLDGQDVSRGAARRPGRQQRLGDRLAPPHRGLDRLPVAERPYFVNPLRYY